MDGEKWQSSVTSARAIAEAVARGDDVPHAPAIAAMSGMWRTAAASGDSPVTYDAPLDERLLSFLPLAYNAAAQADTRWSAADLFERLNTFLAAMFAAKTHPPAEIAAAMEKITKRAFMDEATEERKEKYYFLIIAVGAVIVFSAPWIFGWLQVILGLVATDVALSTMAK